MSGVVILEWKYIVHDHAELAKDVLTSVWYPANICAVILYNPAKTSKRGRSNWTGKSECKCSVYQE